MDRQLVQLEDKGPLRNDDPSALEKGGRWAILYGSELPANERYARKKQIDSFSLPLPVWCQCAGPGWSKLATCKGKVWDPVCCVFQGLKLFSKLGGACSPSHCPLTLYGGRRVQFDCSRRW